MSQRIDRLPKIGEFEEGGVVARQKCDALVWQTWAHKNIMGPLFSSIVITLHTQFDLHVFFGGHPYLVPNWCAPASPQPRHHLGFWDHFCQPVFHQKPKYGVKNMIWGTWLWG